MDAVPHLRPDLVIVYSLDQWARNLPVAIKAVKDLYDLGIRFASCTESEFDFSDPSSRMQLQIFFTFAEHSSAMTSKKVRHVNDLKFQKGLHRGPVPFGYRRDPVSTKGNPLPPSETKINFP
jgi:DNA invertase Pin-like site-specific DNA recombinase